MPTTITRRLEIDAGHRLLRHEGKCANYHGHRYFIDIECAADRLDDVGRVVDFSVVKARVGGWLDEKWDHAMLLQRGDPMIEWALRDVVAPSPWVSITWIERPRIAVLDVPPTAENLARLVFEQAQRLLEPHAVRVVSVTCWETPNCFARYAP
jgi:6-pyruvoyltetrahydropterin/6-carboxytetrahydropterin synthase